MITEEFYLRPHDEIEAMYIEIQSDSELYAHYREHIMKALKQIGKIEK